MKKVIVLVTVLDKRTKSGFRSFAYSCICESDIRAAHKTISRIHRENRLDSVDFYCDNIYHNNYNFESWSEALENLVLYINSPENVCYEELINKNTEVKEMRNMRLKVTSNEESIRHMLTYFHKSRQARDAKGMTEHTKQILIMLYMSGNYTISYDSIDINRLGVTFELTLINHDLYEVYDLECKIRDNDEWGDNLNRKLCELAGNGLLEKYDNADSETFEYVLMEAAYRLGICI